MIHWINAVTLDAIIIIRIIIIIILCNKYDKLYEKYTPRWSAGMGSEERLCMSKKHTIPIMEIVLKTGSGS